MDSPDHDTGAPLGGGGFMLLRQGETLRDGRYVLEHRLGAGGMAAVWLARDELLGRTVAIKLIAETIVDEPAWMERFRREARVAASLSHPNLVEVYDFEPEGPRPYLVMAHVPGGTLTERLEAGDPPEPRRLAGELLAALEHMHAAGVLHRDVKASNVMLGADGSAKLGDFGISRPRDAPAMTETGQVLGSARYMAPEVMAGEEFTEVADLYSTGIVLEELLRARPDDALAPIVAEMADDAPERRPFSARDARARIQAARTGRDSDRTATTRPIASGAAPVADRAPPETASPASEPAAAEPAAPEGRRRAASTPPQGFVPPAHVQRSRSLWPRIAAVAALAAIVIVGLVLALSSGGGETGSGDGGSSGSGAADSGDGSGSDSSGSGSGSGSTDTDSSGSGSGGFSSEDVVPVPTGNNPDLAAQLDGQGKALIDSGDPASAIPILRRAVVASDPEVGDTYAFALYNLGNALRLAGRSREAVAVLEARLEVPNQISAVQSELDLAEADAAQD